ncbi:MAG: crossover junction endodeoxyribonuclease RuvC [Patescibacteria group bacterium]|nr:crossover junction endodeoxyribonuclease RuvC [Patescibacteria group bacterium]
MKRNSKIILGIDPGFARLGWAVIEDSGKLAAIDYGCIETSSRDEHAGRLLEISQRLDKIIKKYKPDIAGMEKLFFSKNVKTAIQVGEARGAILLTLASAGITPLEFTPAQIKQAAAGWGSADKIQIQRMVKTILNLTEIPRPDDAADALAIAICAATTKKFN